MLWVFLWFYSSIYMYSAPRQLSDSGIYTCVATSSSGETSWSAFLEVKGTSGLMFACIFCKEKVVLWSFLSIFSESVGVMVMKNHDENELPGPPSKPQVTDVTKNSVSLSWQPGLPGASPVSSFVIEAFRFVSPVTSKTCSLFNRLDMLWITWKCICNLKQS